MIPRLKPWLGWREFFALFRRNQGAVKRFEKAFAQHFQAVDAVAFPYGRSAQWAFFNAVGIKNAEIIMPAYTCSVVAHAVSLSGNIPRFVDIDIHDYNMNLDAAESAINENTRAIIATHTFGFPQNLDRLENMVRSAEVRYGHKIWLMQDCCHAFGAEWQGRMIGISGDVAVYALNISKIITSIFGGMLTFNDQELADRVRFWRDTHYSRPGLLKPLKRRLYLLAVFVGFNNYIYGITWWLQEKTSLLNYFTKAFHLDDKIHFPSDYLNHMSHVEANVGIVQLSKYQDILALRAKNAYIYDKHLSDAFPCFKPLSTAGATYSHYSFRVHDKLDSIKCVSRRGVHIGELIQYSSLI